MTLSDICWQTGSYILECNFCEHKHECGDYDAEE